MSSYPATIRIVPSRMLLATDLTELKQTLPIAIGYAKRCKAQLKLLHVFPESDDPNRGARSTRRANRAVLEQKAQELLEEAANKSKRAGVKCTWDLRIGQINHVIRQVLDEWQPDRIIVGSSAGSKTRRKLLGSVAEFIFREAEVPIFAVGPGAQGSGLPPVKRARVLFATSLNREAWATTESVLEFARMHHSRLTMLHVIPGIAKTHPSGSRVRAYAEQRFREIIAGCASGTVRPTCMIEKGRIVETILRVAKEGQFDLILLGAVSSSSFRRDILPGTAYGVICGAPCPVLFLKEESDPRMSATTSESRVSTNPGR